MTLRRRLRRAWRAFRDYPGKREYDGEVYGVLIVCGEPHGCAGSGVLLDPFERPPHVEPMRGGPAPTWSWDRDWDRP